MTESAIKLTKDPREEVRRYFSERFAAGAPSDDEIEQIASSPFMGYICANDITHVDPFLRGLPDALLVILEALALDFFEWADRECPESWPAQIHGVAACLYHGEAGFNTATTHEEMGEICKRLSTLTLVERERRDGAHPNVEPYTLTHDWWNVPSLALRE